MGWAKQSGKEMHNRLYLTRVYPLELAKWKLVFEEPMLAGTKIWNACVWESSEAKKRDPLARTARRIPLGSSMQLL